MQYNLNDFTGFILAIYILFIVLFVIYISFRMSVKRGLKEKIFNQVINRMIEDETFERQDLLICYNGFVRKTGFQWSFVRFLEELCFYLTTQKTNSNDVDDTIQEEDNTSSSISVANRIKKIYEIEQRVEPFDELDKNTKYLMSDISKGVSTNDKEYVDNRLNALSFIIGENERKYHKDKSINRWSLVIAISGLVISLIMGYMTITRKTNVSDQDIEVITEAIKSTIIKSGNTIEITK